MRGRTTILLGVLSGVGLGVVILLIIVGLTGGDSDEARNGGAAAGVAVDPEGPARLEMGEEVSPQDLRPVALFFAGGINDLLRAEPRNIFWTSSITERARQVVVELVRGPLPDGRLGPVLPEGMTLREVYVVEDGTAWVDLAASGRRPPLGSHQEWTAIESVALSLTANFVEIRRVGLLLDGEPVESLAGHIDLTRTYTGREWLPEGFAVEKLLPGEVLETIRDAAAQAAQGTAGADPGPPGDGAPSG